MRAVQECHQILLFAVVLLVFDSKVLLPEVRWCVLYFVFAHACTGFVYVNMYCSAGVFCFCARVFIYSCLCNVLACFFAHLDFSVSVNLMALLAACMCCVFFFVCGFYCDACYILQVCWLC